MMKTDGNFYQSYSCCTNHLKSAEKATFSNASCCAQRRIFTQAVTFDEKVAETFRSDAGKFHSPGPKTPEE